MPGNALIIVHYHILTFTQLIMYSLGVVLYQFFSLPTLCLAHNIHTVWKLPKKSPLKHHHFPGYEVVSFLTSFPKKSVFPKKKPRISSNKSFWAWNTCTAKILLIWIWNRKTSCWKMRTGTCSNWLISGWAEKSNRARRSGKCWEHRNLSVRRLSTTSPCHSQPTCGALASSPTFCKSIGIFRSVTHLISGSGFFFPGFLALRHFWVNLNRKLMPILWLVTTSLTRSFSRKLQSWPRILFANFLCASNDDAPVWMNVFSILGYRSEKTLKNICFH